MPELRRVGPGGDAIKRCVPRVRRVVGYGILRGLSPVSGTGRVLAGNPEDDKENVGKFGGSGRRRNRVSRSPLPAWYPRTPLQDITVIVNAIERSRTRRRETAQQRAQGALLTHVNASTIVFPPREPAVTDGTSPITPRPMAVSGPPSTGSPAISSVELFISPSSSVSTPLPPPISSTPASDDKVMTESARKVKESIDEIEKFMMFKKKHSPKVISKRSTLMKMR